MKLLRIGITCTDLSMTKGGIERFAVTQATWMARDGHEVTLFHYPDDPAQEPLFTLDPAISVVALTKHDCGQENFHKVRELALDILLITNFYLDRLYLYPYLAALNVPTLYSEHSSGWHIENLGWNHEERMGVIAYAGGTLLLLPSALQMLPQFLHERIAIIPNGVCIPASTPAYASRPKTVLSVSRLLEADKQLSFLIRAFALIAADFPDWKLRICGEGPDRPLYEELILELGLQDRVELPGNIDEIDAEYDQAQVFCLSSRYEGCPFALLEAMSHALPAVSFGTCNGVNEIIRNGQTGLLAPEMTPESLAETLRTALLDEKLRERLSDGARREALNYSLENTRKKMLVLMRQTMQNHARTGEDSIPVQQARALFLARFRSKGHSENPVFANLRQGIVQKRAKEERKKRLLAQLRKNVATQPN